VVAQTSESGAFHAPFGHGCHDQARESFYTLYPDAAAAALALTGRSISLTPTSAGYLAEWGSAIYRAPNGNAARLPASDDGQVQIALSRALPIPGGAAATLWVHSNGVVSTGPGIDGGSWNVPANDFTPSPRFLDAPDTAFWAWHDWNPAESGSGSIRTEEAVVDGRPVLFISWHNVESFPPDQRNRGTFQFQFDLATGRVAYVWDHVDDNTSSLFGSAHLVGISPGGGSLDPGPAGGLDRLPLETSPDSRALALEASPAPVSTSASGTLVTYTSLHVPEVTQASGQRIGSLMIGVESHPGIDLGFLGAVGCDAYVPSFLVNLPLVGDSPTLQASFMLPPGLPSGLDVFAQSLALCDPVMLPSTNVLGIVTSNAVRSRVAPQ
jgi:hypothetical protein